MARARAAAPMLTMAAPKGRVLEETVELFGRAGVDLAPLLGSSRRLIHELPAAGLRVLVVRPVDVPTYVAHGAADIGVAGADVLEEDGVDVYDPLDLGIGKCRLAVAESAANPVEDGSQIHVRIATKYPNLTRRYLAERGLTAEVIKLYGSIELGPLTGLADRIVDLVSTGETLRQNGLVEVETIMHVTTRLIVNRAALKLRGDAIDALLRRLERVLGAPKKRRAGAAGPLPEAQGGSR
jgi:ATP phosphoribosyltransferase